MPTEWHYTRGEQQLGPINNSKLKSLAGNGTIHPETLIWKEGLKDWVPARKVKGLFPAAPPVLVAENRPPPLPANKPMTEISEIRGVLKNTAAVLTTNFHSNFHIQRTVIIIAGVLGAGATLMPWVSMPVVGTIYGASTWDGWISFCLFVPAIALGLRGDKRTPMTGGTRLRVAIPAGVAGLIGLYKIVNFNLMIAELRNDNPFASLLANSVQIGMGIYLIAGAALAVSVAAWALEKSKTHSP